MIYHPHHYFIVKLNSSVILNNHIPNGINLIFPKDLLDKKSSDTIEGILYLQWILLNSLPLAVVSLLNSRLATGRASMNFCKNLFCTSSLSISPNILYNSSLDRCGTRSEHFWGHWHRVSEIGGEGGEQKQMAKISYDKHTQRLHCQRPLATHPAATCSLLTSSRRSPAVPASRGRRRPATACACHRVWRRRQQYWSPPARP